MSPFFKKDVFEIGTKYHGHGDLHLLLYQKRFVKNWVEDAKKYIVLFKDTDILIFNSIPSTKGTSVKIGLEIIIICVQKNQIK